MTRRWLKLILFADLLLLGGCGEGAIRVCYVREDGKTVCVEYESGKRVHLNALKVPELPVPEPPK